MHSRTPVGARRLHNPVMIRVPFGEVPLAQAVLMSVVGTVHEHGQVVSLQTLLGDDAIHMAPRWWRGPTRDPAASFGSRFCYNGY